MLEVPFARRVLDGSTDVSIVVDDFGIVRIAAAELLCSRWDRLVVAQGF